MPDSLRRGIRTALWFILAAIPGIPAMASAFNLSATTVGKVVAVLTFLGAVFTGVINFAEDKGVIPAFLKATASSGADPITHDPRV